MTLVSISTVAEVDGLASLTHVYRAIEARHRRYWRGQVSHYRRPGTRPTAAVAELCENCFCTVSG